MIALKKYNDGGYVFSGLLDSDHLRENAIKEYLRHEAEIVNFINHNEKNKNDVVFYHSVGTLIKRYEPKNPDDLKYIKDRVRFIFDEKQGGLKNDTSKINYCNYCYELAKFKLKDVEKITHSCWVYLFQCSSLTNILFSFILSRNEKEKKLIKLEGFHRPLGKILTLVLKNINTKYWDNERKEIPVSFSYNLLCRLFEVFDMKNRDVHIKTAEVVKAVIKTNFKKYLECLSDEKKLSNYIEFVVNETKKELKLFL